MKDVRETNAMRALRSLVVAVVATVVLATPAVVLADGRVALVVGNSTHAHIGRLPNPDNDAADISAALWRLGFEVTTELDADTDGNYLAVCLPRGAAENRPRLGAGGNFISITVLSGGSFADLNEDLLGTRHWWRMRRRLGRRAADGRGRNSPYTAALLSHLETPLEILKGKGSHVCI